MNQYFHKIFPGGAIRLCFMCSILFANTGYALEDEVAILQQAEAAVAAGDPHRASMFYGRLVLLNDQNAGYYLGLAQVQEKRGRVDESQKAYEKVLEIEPGNRQALLALARSAGFKQSWELAEQYYKRLLQHHPGDSQAELELIGVLQQLGKREEADQISSMRIPTVGTRPNP
jgi:tetratricopeptide (TPR) repeat protein